MLEMSICSEYLHIPHCEFKKLPREEKIKWIVFADERAKRQQKDIKETETKRKLEQIKKEAPRA